MSMKLSNWPTSLPSTLLRWQIGIPLHRHEMDESPRMTTNIIRQLLKSRSNSSQTGIETAMLYDPEVHHRKRRKLDNSASTIITPHKWSCIFSQHLIDYEFLNQYIIVQGREQSHFFTPSKSIHTLPTLHFSVPSWRSYDVWHIKPNMPLMTVGGVLVKIPNTLILLGENGRELFLYGMETGKKLDEELLEEEYDDVIVHEGEDLIYVGSSEKQYLVFKYPPLQVMHRVVIPSNVWIGLRGFERLGGIALASKKNNVEVFDYEELIAINREESTGRDIVLKKQPEPLVSLKTRNGYLVFLAGSFPPKVVVERRRGLEAIYSLENEKTPIFYVISDLQWSDSDKGMIQCFDEQRQIIFVFRQQVGFDVLGFNEEEGIYKNIFKSKDLLKKCDIAKLRRICDGANDAASSNASRRKRDGLRSRKDKTVNDNLEESLKQWGVGYDETFDLLAVCLFCESLLWTFILDSDTLKMDVFRALDPVQISVPRVPAKRLGCSSINVHFYEWFISVKLDLYNIDSFVKYEQVYTCNLFGEEASTT